jgi:hypothetical protein
VPGGLEAIVEEEHHAHMVTEDGVPLPVEGDADMGEGAVIGDGSA